VHPFAARVVRRVQDGGGRIPIPDAFADLAELERLAQAISRRREPRFDEIESPVYVDGVAFYPPTLGSIAWTRRVAEWFPNEPELADLAMAYGLAHARSAEFRQHDNADAARAAIWGWAARCGASIDRVREAVAALLPAPVESEQQVELAALRMEHGDEAATWPEPALRAVASAWLTILQDAERAISDRVTSKALVYACIREFGGTEDYWIFEASLDRLLAAADEIAKHNEAEEEAEKRAKGMSGASRWSVEAQGRFNVFARAFERKYGAAKTPASPHAEPLSPASGTRLAGEP
jgi:hypothetical protein